MCFKRKAFVSAREKIHHTAARMSDESPSCNVGLRFVHLYTLMYLKFRRLTSKNGFMYYRKNREEMLY